MRTLALDISTVATGWAVLDDDKIVKAGLIGTDKNLSDSARYYLISGTIRGIMRVYKPSDLTIEDTFYAKDPTVLKKLNRIAGQVMLIWFEETGKSPYFYMAMSARKSFPGLTGKSSKEEIVEAANKFFKLRGKLKDDNVADALVTGYHHYVTAKDDLLIKKARKVSRGRSKSKTK